jgi:hypothetical protein
MSRSLTILGRSLPLGTLLLASPAFSAAVEGQMVKQATNWVAIAMFFVFVVGTLGITLLGGTAHHLARAILYRRRGHHRVPERPGHSRRLHVGGFVPRHFGAGLQLGL